MKPLLLPGERATTSFNLAETESKCMDNMELRHGHFPGELHVYGEPASKLLTRFLIFNRRMLLNFNLEECSSIQYHQRWRFLPFRNC